MQTRFSVFVEGLLQLANKYQLSGELIVVEWNPPPGPRLHEAIHIRTKSETFSIRFIEVAAEIHRRLPNSEIIPLFQYIAKNVGIRRAHGEFVLATNPDLLFSESLISFLATGKLNPEILYRLDRTDVPADVPVHHSVEDQLAWCTRNILRIHTKLGSFSGIFCKLVWSGHVGSAQRSKGLQSVLKQFLVKWIQSVAIKVIVFSGGVREIMARKFRTARRLPIRQLIPRVMVNLRIKGWKQRRVRRWLRIRKRFIESRFFFSAMLRSCSRMVDPRPRLHTNGCGDFTMFERSRWWAIRGYPELPIWSMHLDSLLCYMASASGLQESVLKPPAGIFHLEHENSWVAMDLDCRLQTFARKPWLDMGLLNEVWGQMYCSRTPVCCNPPNWGLGDMSLPEVIITNGVRSVIPADQAVTFEMTAKR